MTHGLGGRGKGLCCLAAGWVMTAGMPAVVAQAPTAAGGPVFEVATVKPGSADSNESNVGFREGHFTTKNASLKFILQIAYNLNSGSDDQIEGAPSWVRSAPFDIDAKEDEALAARLGRMPPEERSATLRLMIQGLLADRFGLKAHFELKELPVDALIVTKKGSKLTRSANRDAADKSWGGLHNDGHGQMEGRGATLAMLVNLLSAQPEVGGRIVVDKTGLPGAYDFTLRWTPDSGVAAPLGKEGSDAAGPSLFTALQEQLGLKIESRKEPLQVLVIDHVEMPSAN